MSDFQTPTEFRTKSLTIDGNDVRGLMVSLSVFENIYTPLITGHVTLMETDSAKFIEKYKIEGVEKRLDKMEDIVQKMLDIQQQQAINQAAICQATNANCSH